MHKAYKNIRFMNVFTKCLLVTLLIITIFSSGCLDKIQTHEREVCLAATHYSETSIPSCSKQQDCLKKTFSEDVLIFEKTTKELHNKLVTYKNNIASATFYFNKSKDNIQKINNACYKRTIPKDVVSNVNDLFFYLANIFKYLDRSSQTSIEIIKDYAIFLKDQEVELIAEEEIYLDFIEINENLNELADITVKDTYVGNLKENAKHVNQIAQELGFSKTYISKISFLDLFAYYYDFSEEVEEEKKIPKLSLSTSYIISRLSNMLVLEKINKQLSRTDNYNLFLVLDKHLGTKNSTLIEFREMNNRVVGNLKKIFVKIDELEKKIEKDKEYLDDNSKSEYVYVSYQYKYNNLSFGRYLSTLKRINVNIEQNKINTKEKEEQVKEMLSECELLVNDKSISNNFYLQRLVERYMQEDNLLKKQEICEDIKKNKDVVSCSNDLLKIIEQEQTLFKEYSFLEYSVLSQEECDNILGIIEYRLESHEKILLINRLIKENKDLFEEYDKLKHLDVNTQIKAITLKLENKRYESLRNVEKIIDVDKKINDLQKINKDLKEINKDLLSKLFAQKVVIKNINNKYYFVVNNPYNYNVEEVRIKTEEVTTSEIKSNTQLLRITKNYITFYEVLSGENLYEVEYDNKQKITTNVVDLRCGYSLIETVVENEIEGLWITLNLGQVILAEKDKYVIDNNNNILFLTEKINKIIYYKELISLETLAVDVSETTEESLVVFERYKIKNTQNTRISGKLGLFETYDEVLLIEREDNQLTTIVENNVVRINVLLSAYEYFTIDVYRMKDKEIVFSEMQEIISDIVLLQNSVFKDVRDLAKNINYPLKDVGEFTLNEIKDMYLIKAEVEDIKYLQINNERIENQVFVLLEELKDYEDYSSDVEEIKKDMYDNVSYAYTQMINLKVRIQEDLEQEKKEENKQLQDKYEYLKSIKDTLGIDDKQVNDVFEKYLLNKDDQTEIIVDVEDAINKQLKSLADELYDQMTFVEDVTFKDIEGLCEKINYLYETVSLKELYNVKYYPKVTTSDAERLLKKAEFLETVTLKQQINKFKEKYDLQEYYDAINAVSETTKQRLMEIKTEKEYVEEEINNLKKDVREELNTFINTQYYGTNVDVIEKAKEKYDNEQYLYCLFLLRNIGSTSNKFSFNISVLTYILIIVLFCFLYIYFKKEKKKDTKTIAERKKKIIRHYE